MATHLPQNQFISNSDAHVPVAPGSAAATPCPQPAAAAAPIETGPDHVPPGPSLPAAAPITPAAAGLLTSWEGPFWLVLAEVLEFPPIDLDEAPLFLRSSLA